MNKSGISPVGYQVLVRPLQAKTETTGGLMLPEEVVEKDGLAGNRGVIIAVGAMAFAFDDWPDGRSKPDVGDTAHFIRYAAAGARLKGADGEDYWIVTDRDILATIEQDNEND